MENENIINAILNGIEFNDILKSFDMHKSELLYILRIFSICQELPEEVRYHIKEIIAQNMHYKYINTPTQFLVIADLHLGNKKDKLKYLDIVYNYATKNGITEIYIVGDLIDNILHQSHLEIDTYEKQYEYFLKNYPFDSTIKNYALLGNHEHLAKRKGDFDILSMLPRDRSDFITLGYKIANIKIYENDILFRHAVTEILNPNCNLVTPAITFEGHSHVYYVKKVKSINLTKNHKNLVHVPHLFVPEDKAYLKKNYSENGIKAGFLHIHVKNHGNYNSYVIQHNLFDNNNTFVNEIESIHVENRNLLPKQRVKRKS